MQYIDHPDLLIHTCPKFKALVPGLCQELPLEPELARQIEYTVKDLVDAMLSVDPTTEDPLVAKVNEIRQNLLQIWADICIQSKAMSVVGHGVYSVPVANSIFQFVKTSLTHPVRQDLVMHAFSIAGFYDLNAETMTANFLGEDCGVHYTVHNAEPNEEDVMKIAVMVQTYQTPNYDNYLDVFND